MLYKITKTIKSVKKKSFVAASHLSMILKQ